MVYPTSQFHPRRFDLNHFGVTVLRVLSPEYQLVSRIVILLIERMAQCQALRIMRHARRVPCIFHCVYDDPALR